MSWNAAKIANQGVGGLLENSGQLAGLVKIFSL